MKHLYRQFCFYSQLIQLSCRIWANLFIAVLFLKIISVTGIFCLQFVDIEDTYLAIGPYRHVEVEAGICVGFLSCFWYERFQPTYCIWPSLKRFQKLMFSLWQGFDAEGQQLAATVPSTSSDQKIALPETQSLWYLGQSKEHRHLLKHPVITSFLFLKWGRIRRFFNRNLRWEDQLESTWNMSGFCSISCFNRPQEFGHTVNASFVILSSILSSSWLH